MKTSTLESLIVALGLMLLTTQTFAQDLVCSRIDVRGSRYGDQMWLFAVPVCTTAFDNGWDGYKMFGTSTLIPQIYACEPTANFQIDAVPTYNNTYISFKAGEDTVYTMKFTHQLVETAYTQLYLIDSVANKIVDVFANGSTYTFTVHPTAAAVKRFKIVTSYPVVVVPPVVPPVVVDTVVTIVVPPIVAPPVVVPPVVVDTVAIVVVPPVIIPPVVAPPVVVDTVAIVVVPPVVVPPVVVPPVVVDTVPMVVVPPVVVPPVVVPPVVAPPTSPVVTPDPKNNNDNKDGKDKKDKKVKITTKRNILVVENSGKLKGKLNVYNGSSGRKLKEFNFSTGVLNFDTNLPKGVYVATAVTDEEEVSINVVIQ